jgi:hypothetical protein
LQAVIFAYWAIYQKREGRRYEYYNLIKRKVIEESSLFGKQKR